MRLASRLGKRKSGGLGSPSCRGESDLLECLSGMSFLMLHKCLHNHQESYLSTSHTPRNTVRWRHMFETSSLDHFVLARCDPFILASVRTGAVRWSAQAFRAAGSGPAGRGNRVHGSSAAKAAGFTRPCGESSLRKIGVFEKG